MSSALRKWLPALAPGLVLLLLGVQVALGLKGFEHHHGGVRGALELPGRLLGWGGVAMLLPLCVWLLLGWWGRGVTGMALKTLGAITLGLAVGALAALAWGEAAGGRMGGPLATLLSGALGNAVAAALLLLMAVPGTLLASARFHLGPAAAPRAKPQAPSLVAPRAAPGERAPSVPVTEHGKGWYPQRRFDSRGNELPVDFGSAKDVGSIRFRDDAAADAAPATATALPKPDASAPDRESGWPRGLVQPPDEGTGAHGEPGARTHVADESASDDLSLPEPLAVRSSVPNAMDRLRPASRTQPRPASAPPGPPGPPAAEMPPSRVFARSLFPKNPGDAVLLPGVRYRDDDVVAAAPAAPTPAAPPPPTAATPAGTKPATDPLPEQPAPARKQRADGKSPRKSRRSKAGPRDAAPAPLPATPPPSSRLGDLSGMAHYRTQLAASGIFGDRAGAGSTELGSDDAPPTAPATPAAPATPSAPAPAPTSAARQAEPAPPAKSAAKSAPGSPLKSPAAPAARSRPKTRSRAADASTGELFDSTDDVPVRSPAVGAAPDAAWAAQLGDAQFVQAVEAALDRGSASPVLLTRRLGLGYARAQALVERMASAGVLGEIGANGSRPVLLTREQFEAARK